LSGDQQTQIITPLLHAINVQQVNLEVEHVLLGPDKALST
jgi:hypothetical protein